MGKIEDSAIEVIEEMSKMGYAVGTFAARVFYQVSNVEALKNGLDAFMHERFSQRLEYFIYEHDKIGNKEKESFYEDLKGNKQNLNYLYEFVEKSRTTTFDLHAKILARISVNLVKNKKLGYYESSLISNMNIFNESDFLMFFKMLKNLEKTIDNSNTYYWAIDTNNMEEEISLRKFMSVGIILENTSMGVTTYEKRQPIRFYKSDFTDDLINILNEVIPNHDKL